jgi:hypothetical protein
MQGSSGSAGILASLVKLEVVLKTFYAAKFASGGQNGQVAGGEVSRLRAIFLSPNSIAV